MTEPLAYAPKEAAAATGVAYTRIREAIASGEIEVRYPSANRAVITRDALAAWLNSLPTEKAS